MLDTLIQGGWLIDGTGNPKRRADVGIIDDRIVEVGLLADARAARTVDARNRLVLPGFVDGHSHSDTTILVNPLAQSTIRQGITTEVVGNCGNSPAPLRPRTEAGDDPLGIGGRSPKPWTTFGEFLEHVETTGVTPNLAWLVGHNTLRTAVGVVGSAVSPDQIATMRLLLDEALDAGAIGLSTGLEFDPGRYASTAEIVALAEVVGRRGGFYVSHIRNRAKALQPAITEFINIMRQSGTRGQVSHLNVRANTGAADDAWARAVAAVERARDDGLDIQCDCTPYVDGGGAPTAILPMWVTEKGRLQAADYLREPVLREEIKGDCDRYWAFITRGDWHRIRIASSSNHPEIVGLDFDQIAALWGRTQWDCLLDLFVEVLSREGHVGYIGQLFTEDHVMTNVQHPLFSLGVDAATVATDGPLKDRYVHPLPFAGMVHYLTHWVRHRRALSLEDAVRKMTSMPASRFGLAGRGIIRPGAFADLVVLDYDKLDDVATLERPVAYCRGVDHVYVNGVQVVNPTGHTAARPGRMLRG